MIAALSLSLLALLPAESPSPEARAIAFLAREVPAWSRDNRCYSCHNNGDAARALLTAHRLSLQVPERALDDTIRWLAKPAGWDKNGGDNRHNDKVLSRIQFASALLAAHDAGLQKDAAPRREAAALVAQRQEKDGSWKTDAEGTVGSPVTYGSVLATVEAVRVLRGADPKLHEDAIGRAEAWLLQRKVGSVMEAAALLLALEDVHGDEVSGKRKKCLRILREGQSTDGGWGPFVNSASETFDTALVLLALVHQEKTTDAGKMLKSGREYLLAQQAKDGSWKETTRPSGGESYAQRISTTSWATMALLATRKSAP